MPPPPPAPAGLHVSATTPDSITWTWTAVEGATGYEVQVSLDETFTDEDEVAVRTATETSYRRPSLPPETGAFLRVRAFTAVRAGRLWGAWSVPVAGMTLRPTVVSLEINETRAVLVSVGETMQFHVNAVWSDGSRQAVRAAAVEWESADPDVATVSVGLVTAVAGGNTTILATYDEQSAASVVSVQISLRTRQTVRVVYASPEDRQFRADYSEAIAYAMADVQSWFRRQTGGLTFGLYEATPEWCRLDGDNDYYSRGHSFEKVVEGLQACAPVGFGGEDHTWIVYADVTGECDKQYLTLGRGGDGVAILHKEDLEGVNAVGDPTVTTHGCDGTSVHPPDRWIGGLAHELAHALWVPHPPGCDENLPTCDLPSLMSFGYVSYPDTYLRFDDKETLIRNPYMTGGRLPANRTEPGEFPARLHGTVLNPSGVPVEGIRISLLVDGFWNWGDTGRDGRVAIGVADAIPGPFALSVHAGRTADCTWLGYYGPGGLTSLRDRATLVSATQAGETGVEIRLPATPTELCDGERTLTGTVFGPDGRPVRGAEIEIGAYCCFWPLRPDGTFEIPVRWPLGLSGPRGIGARSEIVRVRVRSCGVVGFYGPGGFTDREQEAVSVEVGAIGQAIEIRLPASPGELCRPSATHSRGR